MLDLTPSTFEDFEREALGGNVVPVVRSVLADLQTPVGAFLRIAGDARYACLLESIEGGERVARYSFLGVDPWMVVSGRGAETTVEKEGERKTCKQNAVEFLREYFAGKRLARRGGLAPLCGGAVGYLAYDAARWFEPVLDVDGDTQPPGTSDAVWMFFRNIIAFDRVRQQMEITSVVFTDEAEGDRERLRALYQRAVADTAQIESDLSKDLIPASPTRPGAAGPRAEFPSSWARTDFEAAVDTVKEHIVAGDCYQAVISQQFARPTTADPISIYRALRATNPSPYMYFLRLGAETIIGASPELLVRCHDHWLDYRPIAGTRKRGDTEPTRVCVTIWIALML